MTGSARLNTHTATTNVPGPQRPVHTLGRRLLESYPYVPIVGTIRIVVAIGLEGLRERAEAVPA